MTGNRPSRRTVLKLAAGVSGAAVLGGTGMAMADSTNEAGSDAPSVEWRQTYQSEEREYQIDRIDGLLQTDDGGYALSGDGAPIQKTGAENEQFLLLKTDAGGDQQWITFADTDRDATRHATTDVVRTSDGGYGLVGYLVQRTPDRTAESAAVAAAAKVTASGDTAWTATLDGLVEGEDAKDVVFDAAAPTDDGGFVAGGAREGASLCVRYAADGSVVWETNYDGYTKIHQVFTREDGYLLFCGNGDRPAALLVDENGTLQASTPLGVDLEQTPYNHVFVPTEDGGYAYTGRDDGRENMVLGKLDETGERQWREEYDGPYEGRDWAFDVLQTADGGYALGGYMSEAYSGDAVPTVLKAGADGAEQWQKLLKDEAAKNRYDTLVQTADGGFACQIEQTLVKLAPAEESSDGTATATPTETSSGSEPTEEPATEEPATESPTDEPSTDAPTESPSDGEPTTDAPVPNTDAPTDDATSTPTDGGSSGGDCDI